jgi:hypothetical protein
MPFTLRPFRCFPVPCSVTYNGGLFLKLPLCDYLQLPPTLHQIHPSPYPHVARMPFRLSHHPARVRRVGGSANVGLTEEDGL